jgi:sphingosine kinase
VGDKRRLDIHAFVERKSVLHLSKMHVLVEPTDMEEAEDWIQTAMTAAYKGEDCVYFTTP